MELSKERISRGIVLLTSRTKLPFEILGEGNNGLAFCSSQAIFFMCQLQQFDATTYISPHFLPHV